MDIKNILKSLLEQTDPRWDFQRTFSSVQSLSHVRLCYPMNCSMPGFPIYHQLFELAQTHVHRVSGAIEPSHPLLSLLLPPSIFPSIRIFLNESVLQSDGQSIGVSASASVLPMNIQDCFPLWMTDLISLQSSWESWEKTIRSLLHQIQKHQFFSSQPSLVGHEVSWTQWSQPSLVDDHWKSNRFDYMDICQQWCLCFLICCLGLS